MMMMMTSILVMLNAALAVLNYKQRNYKVAMFSSFAAGFCLLALLIILKK